MSRPEPTIALDGCEIHRPATFRGAVEIVVASATPRLFPSHVSGGLGFCVKRGPAHSVTADGRSLTYPADALCVRAPGCVWGCEAAPVGFFSIDVDPSLLPDDLGQRTMRCLPREHAHGVERFLSRLLAGSAPVQKEALAELVLSAVDTGAVDGGRSTTADGRRAVQRARERLCDALHEGLDLDQLSGEVGANKFVLIRKFRREIGTTPHSYRNLVRIERARDLLARGADAADVAARLGFADQSHFSRLFKRVLGVSPRAYARRVRTCT